MQCSATPQSSCPGIGVLVFAFAYRSQKNWTLSSCRIHRSWRTSTLGHKCWLVMSSPMRFDRFDKYVSDLATSAVLHSKLSQNYRKHLCDKSTVCFILWPSTGIYRLQDGDLRSTEDKKPIFEDPMAFQEYLAAPWKKLLIRCGSGVNRIQFIHIDPILSNQIWCSLCSMVETCKDPLWDIRDNPWHPSISEPDIIQSRPRRMLARVCQRCDVLGDG